MPVMMMAMFAAAPSPTAPIDFLVGHCWVGKPKPTQVDRHCFRRAADGSIVDHHEASEGGRVLVSGDTVYRWNAASGAIRYTYRDSMGGVQTSTLKRNGDRIDFATAPYRTKDGKSYPITAKWTIIGPTTYRTEMSSPLMPLIKRTTEYNRAD